MNIAIEYIKDSGNLEKERIVFSVKADDQLGKYLMAESIILEESRFSANIRNTYWFPDQEIKAGDRIVLYTKVGTTNVTENEDGTKTYFYYWGLNSPHSNDSKPCVVLFEATWTVSAISNPQ